MIKTFRNIERFYLLPRIEKELLIKALFLFFYGRIIIRTLPLKYYLPVFQPNIYLRKTKEINLQTDRVIRLTIKRVQKILPFKLSCIERVFISAYLSKNLNIQYHIKLYVLKNNNNTLIAHSEIIFNHDLFEINNSNITSIVLC